MAFAEYTLTDTELVGMLHERGIRPSIQRIAVLACIANCRRHPTADEIYREISQHYPSLSRTTVYNSLHALVEGGLVRELEIRSGTCNYDLAPQPRHSHFSCRRCGQIFDLPMPETVSSIDTGGFAIDSVDVIFSGLCPKCRKQTN